MATFFTSDLHLGHNNILMSCGRPFDTVEEMDNSLIAKWNQKVSADDDVYILGDLSFRSGNHISHYLNRMAGHKYLVVGNHDVGWMKNVKDMSQYFEAVENMMLINMGKNQLTLCHYPLLEWNRSRYAQDQATATSWLIHGHIHNSQAAHTYRYIKEYLPCALNAGVDVNHYEPVTFEELLTNNNRWYEREGIL